MSWANRNPCHLGIFLFILLREQLFCCTTKLLLEYQRTIVDLKKILLKQQIACFTVVLLLQQSVFVEITMWCCWFVKTHFFGETKRLALGLCCSNVFVELLICYCWLIKKYADKMNKLLNVGVVLLLRQTMFLIY